MDTAPALVSQEGTPLAALLDHEAKDLAERALARLSPQDREVVVLYYRGDGTIDAVAGALGITEPAARKRLHRGRERLKAAVVAVEATVRATRPGTAFTAACVAAYVATGGTASADALAAARAPARAGLARALAIPVATVVVLAAGWAIQRAASSGDDAAPAPLATAITAPDEWAAPVRAITPPQHAALAEKIRVARAARIARTAPAAATATAAPAAERTRVYDFSGGRLDEPPPPPPTAPRPPGPLTKSDLRRGIHSVQPILLECYQSAAGGLSRTDGTLVAVIRFVGEPGTSTLVESTRLEGDAHLVGDAELAECVNETLMTIELPPMDDGGAIEVIYPFVVGG